MSKEQTDFDAWFCEQEGFGIRAERFDGDVAWLKAAFEAGRSSRAAEQQEPVALADWRKEITHPNNRLLFKRMVEKAGIDLATDDIASGLAKVAALPSPPPVSEKRVERAKSWFDDNFNGLPDTDTLVRGVLTAALLNGGSNGR